MLVFAVIPCQFKSQVMEQHKETQDIREEYERVQSQREKIDECRDAWLKAEAQPLLDKLEDYSLQSSLPDSVREEINSLREQLRMDSYGYSNIIDTSDLQEIINVKETRARELSAEGRLGFGISRFYIHSIPEAEHFARKDRPVGKHRTKN